MKTIPPLLLASILTASAEEEGFVSLFNGQDLTHWIAPEGDGGHWKVANGVIDCDACSEALGMDKTLWTATRSMTTSR